MCVDKLRSFGTIERMAKTTKIDVQNGHEYATFFVEESDVVPRKDGQGVNASATWVAYSSFGVYGHHWSSMGKPFGVFIKDVEEGYLLGKIASKKLDTRKMLKSVRAAIVKQRKDKVISLEVARDALTELTSLSEEHGGEVLCYEIYINTQIAATGIDLCECESLEWPGQAVQFVRKIWPKFVEAFNKQM